MVPCIVIYRGGRYKTIERAPDGVISIQFTAVARTGRRDEQHRRSGSYRAFAEDAAVVADIGRRVDPGFIREGGGQVHRSAVRHKQTLARSAAERNSAGRRNGSKR